MLQTVNNFSFSVTNTILYTLIQLHIPTYINSFFSCNLQHLDFFLTLFLANKRVNKKRKLCEGKKLGWIFIVSLLKCEKVSEIKDLVCYYYLMTFVYVCCFT